MTSKRKLMFLSRPRINDVEILSNFSDYINELCEKSLNTLPGKLFLPKCFLIFLKSKPLEILHRDLKYY